jgi:tetratricopeptide (TPR) repeat protein
MIKRRSKTLIGLDKAQAARGRGAFRTAISEYEKVLAQHPERADVFVRVADLYSKQHDKKAAHSAYMKAAAAFVGQGFPERALAAYLSAARVLPREPTAWREAAELELQRSHKTNGMRLLMRSADALSKARQHEAALVLLRRAFSLEPFQLEVSLSVARALLRTGRRQEARSLLVRLAFERRPARWALIRAFPRLAFSRLFP